MISPTTPSAKLPAKCTVVMQVQDDGTFKRIHPEDPGMFACADYGTITLDPSTAFSG